MNKVLLMSGLISVLISSTVLAVKGVPEEGLDNNPPPSTGNQINACVHKKKGDMRKVATSNQCNKKEYFLSWNIQGLRGDTGSAGAKGDTGSAGATGPEGPIGESSMPPEPYVLGDNPELGGFVIDVTPDGQHGIVLLPRSSYPEIHNSAPNRILNFPYELEIINTPTCIIGVCNESRRIPNQQHYDWRLPNFIELAKIIQSLSIGEHDLENIIYYTGGIAPLDLGAFMFWQAEYNCINNLRSFPPNVQQIPIGQCRLTIDPVTIAQLSLPLAGTMPQNVKNLYKDSPSYRPIIMRTF